MQVEADIVHGHDATVPLAAAASTASSASGPAPPISAPVRCDGSGLPAAPPSPAPSTAANTALEEHRHERVGRSSRSLVGPEKRISPFSMK